jgi:fructokinase
LEFVPEDALKIFDINLRNHFYSKEIIENSLQNANILKINDEEVSIIATLFDWRGSEEEICKKIMTDYSLKIVVETKGSTGSYVLTPNETSYLATPKVHVADTVGAGDSFNASFVVALLHGESIRNAHKLAIEVSAYVCTQHGAMPQLPDDFVELYK